MDVVFQCKRFDFVYRVGGSLKFINIFSKSTFTPTLKVNAVKLRKLIRFGIASRYTAPFRQAQCNVDGRSTTVDVFG